MKNLKRNFILTLIIFASFMIFSQNMVIKNNFINTNQNQLIVTSAFSKNDNLTATNKSKYKMAIVIDDFGSYDQSGVQTLLNCPCTLTCAVLPNVDYTEQNIKDFSDKGHEIILHMPMQSHVNLPLDWYGPVFISSYDTPEKVYNKLNSCLKQFDNIKGFNIHIGSGVSRNKDLMKVIYNFAKENNLYFLDSRTIMTNATENACKETDSIYLGRDVFLEADKNRSYQGVCYRLYEGAEIAKQKGYSIVIGHVGAEGGENTAKAILDTLPKIKEMGIEIVPLSEIYNDLVKIKTNAS
ncbi:MAG: divergent polysaccharide deacetylase family protein [Clostridia bacterium]|nr:divergent polysaccharide deacetylase family protein [Clostridia bacterium]